MIVSVTRNPNTESFGFKVGVEHFDNDDMLVPKTTIHKDAIYNTIGSKELVLRNPLNAWRSFILCVN